MGPNADFESSRRGASSGILDLYVGHEEVLFLKNGAHEVIDLEYCSRNLALLGPGDILYCSSSGRACVAELVGFDKKDGSPLTRMAATPPTKGGFSAAHAAGQSLGFNKKEVPKKTPVRIC